MSSCESRLPLVLLTAFKSDTYDGHVTRQGESSKSTLFWGALAGNVGAKDPLEDLGRGKRSSRIKSCSGRRSASGARIADFATLDGSLADST